MSAPTVVRCPAVVHGDAYRLGQVTLDLKTGTGPAPLTVRAGMTRPGLRAPHVRDLPAASRRILAAGTGGGPASLVPVTRAILTPAGLRPL